MRVHSAGRDRSCRAAPWIFSTATACSTTFMPRRSSTSSFNRTQPKSRTIPITFAKPEIVRINCDLHSWMRRRGWSSRRTPTTRSPAPTDSSLSTTCRRASTSSRSGTSDWAPSQASVTVGDQQACAGHRRDESALSELLQGRTAIFFDASQAAECVGSSTRAQRSALVERDRERHRRRRVHRMEIDARNLHRVLVERDVADEVLGQRGMLVLRRRRYTVTLNHSPRLTESGATIFGVCLAS